MSQLTTPPPAPRGRRTARSTLLTFGLVLGAVLSIGTAAVRYVPTTAAQPANSTYELQVTGRAGIPANASAVSINFAAVNAGEAGFLTAYPCGSSRPSASTLNYLPGDTIANSTIVAVGNGGKVCIYNRGATDILADVNGWFPNNADFNSQSPSRLLDTRPNTRPANSTYELQVTGRAGIPANASAVSINFAAVNAGEAGFLTAYPCGSSRPSASTLNYLPGDTIANSTIVAVGNGGKVCIYNRGATDILADVNGWFPNNADFNSQSPSRLLDTRPNTRPANSTYELQVTGRAGIPANASAVSINFAAVNAGEAGFLTAYPCGSSRPSASTLNYLPGDTIANSTIVAVGNGGKVCIYNRGATDILADVNGWFPNNADFNSQSPSRLLDTRQSGGPGPAGPNDFVETFSGNTGLDRLVTGVFHRDEVLVAETQWTGDHDLNCGSPDTQRTIRRNRPDDSFYLCRDHMMTSIGDTSGYSIGWFSPDGDRDGRADVFSSNNIREVSWDVNVTDLGARQWWEVVLVADGTPFLTTVDWVASISDIEPYHSDTIAVGVGPFGRDGNIFSGNRERDPLGWSHVPAFDPEGAASKAIRRSFKMTDNRNGTITFQFLGQNYTYAGEFPSEFSVYFKDHNYTPDKDGRPVGYTWHWDNLVVRG